MVIPDGDIGRRADKVDHAEIVGIDRRPVTVGNCKTVCRVVGARCGDAAQEVQIGAGIGKGEFTTENAFSNVKALKIVEPKKVSEYENVYQDWKGLLEKQL